MNTPSYELFIMPTCPFCLKVTSYMKSNNIDIPILDTTRDASARQRLLEVGGKTQVPCLFIDGAPMYESDDIIAYLSSAFA